MTVAKSTRFQPSERSHAESAQPKTALARSLHLYLVVGDATGASPGSHKPEGCSAAWVSDPPSLTQARTSFLSASAAIHGPPRLVDRSERQGFARSTAAASCGGSCLSASAAIRTAGASAWKPEAQAEGKRVVSIETHRIPRLAPRASKARPAPTATSAVRDRRYRVSSRGKPAVGNRRPRFEPLTRAASHR